MYVTTQVHFAYYIIVTNPHIVLEFIVHPGNGGEPRVDEQYVHLLCDTSTHVLFVHFGSKCHNTLIQKTVCYATVHFLTVHYKMAQQQSKFLKMLHVPRIELVTFMTKQRPLTTRPQVLVQITTLSNRKNCTTVAKVLYSTGTSPFWGQRGEEG
jgi:hypothetical protein